MTCNVENSSSGTHRCPAMRMCHPPPQVPSIFVRAALPEAIVEDLHNRNIDTVSDGNFRKRLTLPANAPHMSRDQLWERLIADGNLIAVGPKGKSQATL
jgi:hypothetical protein